MALGFAPAILTHLGSLMANNYPGTKIIPSGFMKMLVQNNPKLRVKAINGEKVSEGPNGMKLNTDGGQIRDVTLKSLPRITPDQVVDEDNCDNDVGFQYSETNLETPLFSKLGFPLEWSFVERYQAEAAKLTKVGAKPDMVVLEEMLEQIMHCVSGIVHNMDRKLLAQVVWGVNVVTGNNNVKNININQAGNTLNLSDGVTEILNDAAENEVVGDLMLAGSGNFNKFNIAKNNIGINAAGINQGAQNGYSWYHDVATNVLWGANQVGAFAKGAVGYVDIDRYIAWKRGRHGVSHFGQISLPIESHVGGAPVMVPFNLQIRESDCPTEGFDGYETRTMGRGYQVFLSKNFGLWQSPTSAYQGTDRLAGNNGSYRYAITNTCDSCP